MSFARGNGIENRPCIIHLRSGIYQSWFSSSFLLRYARFLRICAIYFRLIFTFCSQHLSMKNTGCFWQNEKSLRKKRKDGKLSERRYSQWNLISGGYRWNHITNQMEIQTKMWTVWSITFSTHNRFKFFYLTKKMDRILNIILVSEYFRDQKRCIQTHLC